MLASWKWLSEFVDLKETTPPALADLMTRRGLEVEGVRPLAQGFEKVVTVKILKRDKHPQADRLSLCQVTTGKGDPLEIVCGAQNMKAGDIVALAQVGAQLPNGMKIELSKIRGVASNGMLCSEEELGLKAKAEGILILPPNTPLGRPLAEILGRDDVLLDFNLTPNRGDCLSHWGLAREIAAALGQKPKRKDLPELKLSGCPIKTSTENETTGPQFWGCLIEGVKVGPSPEWMVKRLEAIGARSINNVVDCSNWVLHELGQPTHAYDADRLEPAAKGGAIELRIRLGKKGEKLPLLDDREVELAGTELVIADGRKAVALAGVMGGGNSQVTDKTTRIFLEVAEFAPVLVRKAAFLHQRRTDAAMRFEKGIDPAGLPYALSRLAHLIVETSGGKIVGATAALAKSREPKALAAKREISLKGDYIPAFLGVSTAAKEIKSALNALQLEVEEKGNAWTVAIPSYRLDLELKEDLAEEVARSIGYEKIPSTIPPLTSAPNPVYGDPSPHEQSQGVWLESIDRAKDALVRQGLSESIQFSFNSKAWLSEFGMASTIPVLNPLSEEQEVLVPSLIPGLVQAALRNWHHHFGSEALPIRLFELRPTFVAREPLAERDQIETGAEENWKLGLLLSGPRLAEGLRAELGEVDLFDLKGVIEGLLDEMGARGVRLRALSGPSLGAAADSAAKSLMALLHPFQSFEVVAGKDVVGAFGQAHPRLAKKLKFRGPVWMGELDWRAVSKLSRPASRSRSFKPWSEFPTIERDFALLVKSEVTAEQIVQVAVKAGKPLAKVARVFDIYKGQQVVAGMTSVAIRVIFSEETRSLKEEEADEASSRILARWKEELGAELRS